MLFILSAMIYSGGNYLHVSAPRFSIVHNYWCDLLNETSHNGSPNASRPYSILATVILCISLVAFWLKVANYFSISKVNRIAIQFCGTLSMLIGMLIFTPLHSEAITFAGFFGGIAFIATFIALYKSGWRELFWFGILCLLLGAISFTIYKTRFVIVALPLVQKITLLCCLIWIFLIDRKIKNEQKFIEPTS